MKVQSWKSVIEDDEMGATMQEKKSADPAEVKDDEVITIKRTTSNDQVVKERTKG